MVSLVSIKGQSTYRAGILPVFNFSVHLSENWNLNLRHESRHSLLAGQFSESTSLDYDYQLSDLAVVASRSVGLGKYLAAGMQIRHSSGIAEYRLMQQFTFSPLNVGLRSAHRIALDQSFREEGPTRYRLRYRYVIQWALNGQSADAQEWYLKLGGELLNALEEGDYELEFRLLPFLGYRLSSELKFEVGLDFRLSEITDHAKQYSFWQSFALYYVF